VLLTGGSAGGLGVIANFVWMRERFEERAEMKRGGEHRAERRGKREESKRKSYNNKKDWMKLQFPTAIFKAWPSSGWFPEDIAPYHTLQFFLVFIIIFIFIYFRLFNFFNIWLFFLPLKILLGFLIARHFYFINVSVFFISNPSLSPLFLTFSCRIPSNYISLDDSFQKLYTQVTPYLNRACVAAYSSDPYPFFSSPFAAFLFINPGTQIAKEYIKQHDFLVNLPPFKNFQKLSSTFLLQFSFRQNVCFNFAVFGKNRILKNVDPARWRCYSGTNVFPYVGNQPFFVSQVNLFPFSLSLRSSSIPLLS
jgi:hypothetical protein